MFVLCILQLGYSAHITISRWDIYWFHAKVNGNQLLSQNQSHRRPSVANANAKPIAPDDTSVHDTSHGES